MIIIMIITVMILYFFASYSLYVAPCFSVVNKRKAPSHLLSAPEPEEANAAPTGGFGAGCVPRAQRHPNPGQTHSLNSSLPSRGSSAPSAACLQGAGTRRHRGRGVAW